MIGLYELEYRSTNNKWSDIQYTKRPQPKRNQTIPFILIKMRSKKAAKYGT